MKDMITGLLEVCGVFVVAGAIVLVIWFILFLLFGTAYDHTVHSNEREKVCYDLGLTNGEHTADCFDLSPKEVKMLRVENREGGPALTSGLIQLRGGVLTFKRIGDTK